MTILLCLFVPFVGSFLILATGSRPNLRETMTLLTAITLFLLVASIYPLVAAGERPGIDVVEMLPGLSIAFKVEPLGMAFALIASFLWIFTSIYSIGYMRGHHEENQTRFYFYFAISLMAAIGIAFAGNMITLFIFYEVLTLCTFPLVAHHGTEESKRAGRVYLGLLLGTSIAFQLFAIIWTWVITGTLDFTKGGILAGTTDNLTVAILLALYVFGIGKAAVMPFHRWLPAAMVAPTPVSALLHAVAVVKAGVFTVLKVTVYIFGVNFLADINVSEWLQYAAAITILLSSLVAMTKDNLKARLAYSTVSQLSYCVLGAMLVNSWGILGGGMQIAMHAFAKITLFFCAGAILVAAHKTEISDMGGLGKTMPFTFTAFFLASLSIIGLPPFGGAWSKFYLAYGALEAGQLALVAALMISSLLNVYYLLSIPFRGFFGRPPETPGHYSRPQSDGEIHEAPIPCLIAISVSTVGCVVLFFYTDPLYNLLKQIILP
ncbi:MAG: monovalent cation/H+ antiporter subunit D family protein [Rhodospirillaceae bacterium]|jgi:multicomponent Na+:H+ antiporter subunit D